MNSFRNVRELLEDRVQRDPLKKFLFSESDGREWTYGEFDAAVKRTAGFLASIGIAKGHVVSLLLKNSPEYVIAYFACFSIGAIAGPVNSLLKSEEIEWVIGNSKSKLLLVGSDWKASIPARLKEKLGSPGFIFFDDVTEATKESSAHPDAVPLTPDNEAIIIYTSGTTGKPKGCLLTHGNLIANARQIAEWMGFGPDDRLLTVMPLFHMNAVSVTTMTALYAGGSTVVSPKFSASRFWDIIEKYKITSFGSVATMLSMLLSRQQEDERVTHSSLVTRPSPLRFAMCGSAPVPAEVLKKFEEAFGVLVIEGYGLSESTCRSTFNPPNQNRRPGSCGLPIGNEMKVFDENDVEVPDGELGEIVLRGENIFKGYFNNPKATEKAFAKGWFHTGDIGYRDADGFFYIADRKSDMIIRGGENIYPREIDDVLYTHPAVAHAAVIGVPDELYGEEVAAFVVLKEGYTRAETRPGGNLHDEYQVTAGDLIDFCKQHLADYKCPKTLYFVDDIPKGPTGKLLKRELRAKIGSA
ncbi:MAG: long-chain fatty acid--CoA ligase [Chloracidobacterium sp.]|nr:long-chain fatty acid--CoA ligase [Chloracidobacterium sp.]